MKIKHVHYHFPMGIMRSSTKSDLLNCLQDLASTMESLASCSQQCTCRILDDAVIVNMLRPSTAKTFEGYASEVFLSCITAQLQHVTRLDIVWDRYSSNSLKADTHSMRGSGVRKHVEPSGTLPGYWQFFVRIDDNKTELFTFRIANIVTSNQIISIYNANVLCTNQREVSCLSTCNIKKLTPGSFFTWKMPSSCVTTWYQYVLLILML